MAPVRRLTALGRPQQRLGGGRVERNHVVLGLSGAGGSWFRQLRGMRRGVPW